MRLSGASGIALVALCVARVALAQQWNDVRVRDLVQRATDRRAQQLADTGLRDYHATAHGYVTFLAQLGEGFREPPRIVKADELLLEVYWRAPNLSKQLIMGRRDTTLLPTDIQYHRDHLGIVQNNFPAIIRLGDGDEVRDVPHPLSVSGLREYEFALADSLRITIPGRVIDVYEVKVRPADDSEARLIGALYLERETGQVVRMAFSFTRAAYLDRQLEDLFVVLENGLVGTRFWLPLHQEVEIRRSATWMDFPIRGIIRGRWEIGGYELNTGLPGVSFAGPEISVGRADLRYDWPSARILDSLPPDVRVVGADEIRRVQAEARALVRTQALRRDRNSVFAASGITDIVRFNRAEGTALGGGATARVGAGFRITARARYGTADDEIKAGGTLSWSAPIGHTFQLFAERDYAEVGVVPERSQLVNSLAAQEFASDYTDPFWTTRIGGGAAGSARGVSWGFHVARERHLPSSIRASPATGRFPLLVPVDSLTAWTAALTLDRPTALWLAGLEMRVRGAVRIFQNASCPVLTFCPTTWLRFSGDAELQRPIGDSRIVSRTVGGLARARRLPAQALVAFGGPITAPGYDFHSLVGRAALSQRIELQVPAPFPAFSIGRFGRTPAALTLAPFATVVALRAADSSLVTRSVMPDARDLFRRESGFYPAVGIGALFLFDALRVDVARGLRDGRWTFSVDANRSFWGVL
jgi:hypothetical protein